MSIRSECYFTVFKIALRIKHVIREICNGTHQVADTSHRGIRFFMCNTEDKICKTMPFFQGKMYIPINPFSSPHVFLKIKHPFDRRFHLGQAIPFEKTYSQIRDIAPYRVRQR